MAKGSYCSYPFYRPTHFCVDPYRAPSLLLGPPPKGPNPSPSCLSRSTVQESDSAHAIPHHALSQGPCNAVAWFILKQVPGNLVFGSATTNSIVLLNEQQVAGYFHGSNHSLRRLLSSLFLIDFFF